MASFFDLKGMCFAPNSLADCAFSAAAAAFFLCAKSWAEFGDIVAIVPKCK